MTDRSYYPESSRTIAEIEWAITKHAREYADRGWIIEETLVSPLSYTMRRPFVERDDVVMGVFFVRVARTFPCTG